MTGEDENQWIVEQVYAAFGRGDLPRIVTAMAEDVEWRHPRPDDIPWGGERRGHRGVTDFLEAMTTTLAVEQFTPLEFLVEDERVVVLGRERMRVRATGLAYEADWVHAWTVHGGKITRFREYTDTAAIVEALRGRETIRAAAVPEEP
jgi:ketosteroid isomerase-like protein